MQTDNDVVMMTKILVGLAKMKKHDLDEFQLQLWRESLRSWTLSEFSAAAALLARKLAWFPTPHDFDQLKQTSGPSTQECWEAAYRHAASSAYRKGLLGVELIDRTVQAMGGYVAIAMATNEELPWLRKRFDESIVEIRQTAEIRDALPQLANLLPSSKTKK